jgi:hypothetical protein
MEKDFWVAHGLRCTNCRAAIVHCLESKNEALSERALREEVGSSFDRTTFYRTMRTLEERKIIHRITAAQEGIKWALSTPIGLPQVHAHFVCNVCDGVWCLTQLRAPVYVHRKGFTTEYVESIVHGVCSACNQRAKEQQKKLQAKQSEE